MKKKLLAILLTLAMVVTMIPAVFVTVTAEAAFEPKTDEWFAANGYTAITTQAELKAATMGTAPDAIAKYYLKNDIVVADGTTAALMGELKYIELDGNGHTISNVQATAPAGGTWPKLGGISNRVYGYTTVKNLNVTGSVASTADTENPLEIGGLFGAVNGLVKVENVHANMTVTGNNNSLIGGLSGQCVNTGENGMNQTGTEQTNTDVTFTNCSFAGEVKAGSYNVGGLVGYVNAKNLTMTDCESLGKITVTGGKSEPHVGGIIGEARASAAITLTRVVRNADLEEANKKNGVGTGWSRVGGFIGVAANAAYDLDIVDCKSYGTLNGTNDTAGFIGVWYTNDDADKATLVGCENYSTSTASGYAGFIAYPNGTPVYLKDCANYADIICKGQVAGFIRNCKTNVTMDNCVNYGTIESYDSNSVGGFVALIPEKATGTLTMNNCVNFGTIQTHRTAGWQRLGGMVGEAGGDNNDSTFNIYLNYCANLGQINGATKVGQACYGDMIGGFGAKGTKGTVALKNCYGAGNIIATDDNLSQTHALVGRVAGTVTATGCVTGFKLSKNTDLLETQFDAVAIDENSDLAAVVVALNSGLAAGNEAFVLDDGQIEPLYALNKVATQVYATQEAKTGAADTVDVRVLALVNSLGYDLAGVELYKAGSDTAAVTETTTTVYSGVINGEDTLYAPYGTYYLPITLKGVADEGTFTVVVKTFVEKDAVKTYSDSYTIVITDGEVVSAEKN